MLIPGLLGEQIQALGYMCGFLDVQPEGLKVAPVLIEEAKKCDYAFCRGRAEGRFDRAFAVPSFQTRKQSAERVATYKAILGL